MPIGLHFKLGYYRQYQNRPGTMLDGWLYVKRKEFP